MRDFFASTLDGNEKKQIQFVCFFNDKKYYEFLILFESIKQNYSDEEFEFNIGIDEKTFEKLENFIYENKINYSLIDENKMDIKFGRNNMMSKSVNKFSMLRLLTFEIFPSLLQNENTLIYLDTDTFLHRRIDDEYLESSQNYVVYDSFTLSNGMDWKEEYYEFIGKYDYFLDEIKNKLDNKKYFNAGVIVINDKAKAKKIFDLASDENSECNLYDDQTLLNYYNNDEFLVIDNNEINYMPIRDNGNGSKNPIFFHFITKWKPYDGIQFDKNELLNLEKGFSDYSMLKRFFNSEQGSVFFETRNKIMNNKFEIIENNLPKLNNDITILLTIYKVVPHEIDFWKNAYLKLKSLGQEIQILFDGEQSKENMMLFDIFDKNDLFISKENIGKARLVYEHIKNGNVKTSHFKTVDPDDYISIERYINLDFSEKEKIIRIPTHLVNKDFITSSLQEIENLIETEPNVIWVNNFGTPLTFLPTEKIFVDKFFLKHIDTRVDIAEDIILGLICYANGAEIIDYEEPVWYMYKFENGISNKDTAEKMINFLFEQIPTINVYIDICLQSKRKPAITYPEKPFERLADFKNSELLKEKINEEPEVIKKIKFLTKEFEILKENYFKLSNGKQS